MLCKYKNILGIPEIGFHKHLYGISIFDLLGTILLAYMYVSFKEKHVNVNVLDVGKIFCILFLIGEILHILFCVKTSFTKLFFD